MRKKIFIIDESRFSRICSALLARLGYDAEIVPRIGKLPARLTRDKCGLIVTSYPYGFAFFDEIKKRKIPMMILSDNLDTDVVKILNEIGNSFCMIKPLDYDRFRSVVKQVMTGELNAHEGFRIV